jgi:hypothetical protein
MENDLSDVVRVLERIEKELNFSENLSTAKETIDTLNAIIDALNRIENRLGDVEQAVKALER